MGPVEMARDLAILNRQRTRGIDLRQVRNITISLFAQLSPTREMDVSIHLVGSAEMAELNGSIMHHSGSTDVITLDYSSAGQDTPVIGELFICVEEAQLQALRFRTTWQSELCRYIAHGLLHLHGFDDLADSDRRRMKRQENLLMRGLARRFDLRKVERAPKMRA